MGILDKLRPQSKSTHPDPNIRIEAIHELDPADLESLNAFAKDDADARVRRVAVARIGDAAVLADIVRNESEGSVRDHALGQLVEQAGKHDAAAAMTAVAALASLGRERELATVAKAAGPEEVRRAGDCGDARREGRSAASRGTRAEASARLIAIERLTDRAEIEGVALRGEHADAAVAAIDKLTDAVGRDADGDRREGAHQGGAEEGAHAAARRATPAGAVGESGPAFKEADQQKARDLVAQMSGLVVGRRLHRSCAKRTPRRASRGSSCWPMPTFSRRSRRTSNRRRPWSAIGSPPTRPARADAERQRRARRAGTGRSRRGVRARRSAQRRRHRRSAGRGACRVGRHAADARGVGRGARSPLRRSVPRGAEAPRAAAAGEAVRRAVADAGAGDRGDRRERRTTTTCAASGTRCASSGRPSPATSRSMRS